MSTIGGFWNLDGEPCDPEILKAVSAAAASAGDDGASVWHHGDLALSYRALHTTAESRAERQPLASADGKLRLVLDGRVDNRAELITELTARGFAPRREQNIVTDAEVVLQAYCCWGVLFARRILGDFSCAIWDGTRQHLLCVRDILGVRPFYYWRGEQTFIFGSALRQVLAHPAVPRRPNAGMVAEHLAAAVTSLQETLWAGVMRLPPAHALIVRRDGMRLERYWDVDPSHAIRYRHDDEYAEHFLELLKQAVGCRLRSDGPVGLDLSGGLDSSVVAGAIHLLQRSGSEEAQGVRTFSRIYPGLPCDESELIRETTAKLALPSHLAAPQPFPLEHYRQRARQTHDFPGYPTTALFTCTAAQVRESGIRVLLTGEGGNHWLEGTSVHLADMARRLQWLELARQAACERAPGQSWWRLLRSNVMKPLAPAALLRAWRRLHPLRAPAWIRPELARETALVERLNLQESVPRFPTLAQQEIYRWGMRDTATLELYRQSYDQHGLEPRHPLHDRRIVEFGLALPERQRWFRRHTRPVMRRAMRGVLPDRVRLAVERVHFDILLALALQPMETLDLPQLTARGWIVPAEIARMLAAMRAALRNPGANHWQYCWPLWMALGLELWLEEHTSQL